MHAPAATHIVEDLPPVGAMLRQWRKHRGLSQMDLSFEADLSARHISFLETGRSQPSRRALGALADALRIPLRERNELFEAAGFAHPYSDATLSDSELAFHYDLVRSVLARHEPWFAVAIDRHWNIRMMNAAAEQFLAQFFCEGGIEPPLTPNLARLLFHPAGLRTCLLNWPDVRTHFMERLSRELIRNPMDAEFAVLVDEMASYVGVPGEDSSGGRDSRRGARRRDSARPASEDLALVLHLSTGDMEARLIGTVMAFDSARSPALEELRIETFFPADEATRMQMESAF
ncbi:MAG: transcriptional regulator [Bacteroidetes bacterium CG12_big_fil_rev_8_21_14_0_65_60_17]|nr:MAG: transcriptional regulator [Bacteroidetes bacterium CG12_big_fil_rev_8_21_14_0_65_60_17]